MQLFVIPFIVYWCLCSSYCHRFTVRTSNVVGLTSTGWSLADDFGVVALALRKQELEVHERVVEVLTAAGVYARFLDSFAGIAFTVDGQNRLKKTMHTFAPL